MKGIAFDLSVSLIAAVFVCLLVLPIFALFTATSFAELVNQFSSPLVLSAIVISLETSLIVVFLALCLGIPVAYLLATKQFRGKEILDTLVASYFHAPSRCGPGSANLVGRKQQTRRLVRQLRN
jgi:ABC-type sulfate transport system permease component